MQIHSSADAFSIPPKKYVEHARAFAAFTPDIAGGVASIWGKRYVGFAHDALPETSAAEKPMTK